MIPSGTLTLHEVADLFQVNPDHVYAALQAGRLPGFKVGHQWVIERRVLTPHVVLSLQQGDRQQASPPAHTPSRPRSPRKPQKRN